VFRFKLNGTHFNGKELYQRAFVFIKEGEEHEKALGNFILEWFDEKDIPQWENRSVPVPQHTLDLLTAHRTWCDNHSIHYTPATFINGYHYPAEYTLQEFSLFAEQMIEQLREDTVLVYQN